MADEKEKAANGGGEDGTEGQCDTLQHLTQPKVLTAFLDKLEQHEIAPGETLYEENGPISHIFYVLRGKVEIRVAEEVIGVLEGHGVLGAEEYHFRKATPTYAQTAVALERTLVVWLDSHDLRMVFRMDPNCAANYMRLQAGLRREATRRLTGYKGRVIKLGAALEKTQDALLAKSKEPPVPPPRKPSSSTELSKKWETQCRTIEVMLRLIQTRATNLEGLLVALRELAAKHPDWAKQGDFAEFLRKTEELVACDSRTTT